MSATAGPVLNIALNTSAHQALCNYITCHNKSWSLHLSAKSWFQKTTDELRSYSSLQLVCLMLLLKYGNILVFTHATM